MTENLTVDPVLGMRSRFRTTREDGDREVLHVETWIAPGGGVTPHVHAAMEERFEVLEGRPEFLAGRRWRPSGPGETVVVPPGTRHAFRNRGAGTARVVCHASPPSSLQAFLEDTAAMSRAGAINRRGLPTSFDGLLRGAVLAHEHRDMVTLLAPLPPAPVQRLLFPLLARAGARRGYGPGRLG